MIGSRNKNENKSNEKIGSCEIISFSTHDDKRFSNMICVIFNLEFVVQNEENLGTCRP